MFQKQYKLYIWGEKNMVYQINYENIEIEYTLHRKKVKYINLRINKKGEITVSAPYAVALASIHDFVKQKAPWIILHLAKIEKVRQHMPWNDFHDGKTLYFLGRPYRLIISIAPKNYVFPDDFGNITIYSTASQDQEAIYKAYLHWLRQKAIITFAELMEQVYPLVAPLSIAKPIIQIRNMKTLWGSCTSTGNSIRLNLQLMKAPESCIKQVILHELLHFRFPHHNQEFYAELERLMPEYKTLQKELDQKYKDGV